MKRTTGTIVTAWVFIGLVTLACNKSDTSSGSDTGNGSDSTVNNGADSAVNPEPVAIADCQGATGMAKIICLTSAFKALLTTSQLSQVQLDYSVTDAKKWSNLPQALSRNRVGLNFGAMTTTQIEYAKAILVAASGAGSNEGWDELQQLINADQYLSVNEGGSDYGAANYYIAFLGIPASTGTFEIQYGGHHTAFANTYKDGVLVGATPSFRGVEPFATFTWDGKSNQPIQQEQAAFAAMLGGLTTSEQASAKLSGTYSDLVAGPGEDGNFLSTPSGIACSILLPDQKLLVMTAIKTYVNDVADSASIISKYAGELDNTYIAYSGSTGVSAINDYVRIDGPSVWIEYSVQHGIVLSAAHPHSIWRDKSTDYGGN